MIMNLRAALILVFLTSTALAEFQLVTGSHGSCALYEGEVRCWGGVYGGSGSGVVPMRIELGDFDAGELFGGYIGCAVSTDRKDMICWGDNRAGTLGQGDYVNRPYSNSAAMESLDPIKFEDMPGLDADYQIEDVLVSYRTVCVLFSQSSGSDVRCWGDNGDHGRHYLGRTGDDALAHNGDSISAMADVRPVGLDYTTFTPVKLGGGGATQCAISAEHELKCWGMCGDARCGGGGAMGTITFGTDDGATFTPNKVQCGENHCCYSSIEGDLRCSGWNYDGRSGFATMSSSNLGQHFVVKDFHVGWESTCALSTGGEVKCVGMNQYGQLGYDSTPGSEVGDNLDAVSIGDAFTAEGVHFAEMGGNFAYAWHRCIVEETVQSPLIQCWGWNQYGQLGYGDTWNRGNGGYTDENGQFVPLLMQDLTYIDIYADLGFTSPPSAEPTDNPSLAPTRSPTDNPSLAPTRSPTDNPSLAPTRSPTDNPSPAPTPSPSPSPTTADPTFQPTAGPTSCCDQCFMTTAEPALIPVVDQGNPSANCNCLAECAGDCDSDGDCVGDLECFHRNGWDDPVPPGCSGEAHFVSHDYCYAPPLTAHYIARGNPTNSKWNDGKVSFHCHDDKSNQALYSSKSHAFNIGVGCCAEDGSNGYRPDCDIHPATYQDAVNLCTSNGYRLCTLQETLSGLTKGEGCSYDAAYQWVSDECSTPAIRSVDASAAMQPFHVPVDEVNESAESAGNMTSVVLGAAMGVAVVAAIVVFVVMIKRRKGVKEEEEIATSEVVTELSTSVDIVGAGCSAKEEVFEMAKMAHVPEVSPASVDGVETV